MIHHTRGVYPDGSYKDNGVCCKNLAQHISYNLKFRPGRALILDGICVYKGLNVSKAEIIKAVGAAQDIATKEDTAPYV